MEGISQPFEEAIVDCQEALKAYPRDREPLDWAATQNSLGTALAALGHRGLSIPTLLRARPNDKNLVTV